MAEQPRPSSLDRIPTTPVGSLPRPPELAALVKDRAAGRPVNDEELAKSLDAAVAEAVRRQAEAGIDYVNDGEMGVTSFMDTSVRLTGFDGPEGPWAPSDLAGVIPPASWDAGEGEQAPLLPGNTSREIRYLPGRVQGVIVRLREALASNTAVLGGFVTSPSPGVVSRVGSSAFDDREEFVFAIAEALRQEYQIIAAAGLQVQIDSPDLAMGKHIDYLDMPVEEFRDKVVRLHIRALNHALQGIPAEQVRLHVCWGNYPGPHHLDLPLAEIIDLLYEAHVGTLMIEGANAQHRHEWSVFRDHPLPERMNLAVGVVDSLSPHVEHPQTVADALVRLADVVPRERLVATVDCGFATFADVPVAPTELAYLKLRALAEGARIASARLWA